MKPTESDGYMGGNSMPQPLAPNDVTGARNKHLQILNT